MPKLKINGVEIEVEQGMSVIQVCELMGVEIPRFCYHDRLSVPANCRMCLVEQKGIPKPIPSCAIPAADGMEIVTDSDMVHKARQGVMEFLLINHPLDCPICDQGGECDLQDQAMAYGFDRSRYQEEKRAVKDKDLGPIIKTVMTRCIHCTRCIRFAEQVGGMPELGLLGRGEDTEVGTFVEAFVTSELSGNLVDICPVGALTSKPYAFKARPWELRKTETIDVMDAVGSNIRVDSRGNEVMRVLPRLHEEINEEWISDKTRYAYDGLMKQRLDTPYIRKGKNLQPATWDEAFAFTKEKLAKLKGREIGALVGDQVDSEATMALKDLMTALGSPNLDCRQDGALYDVKHRSNYIMNTTIAGVEEADLILLIGTNPRWEAPMVNARILKAYNDNNAKIVLVGQACDLNYPYEHLDTGAKVLEDLTKGKGDFAKTLKKAKNPIMIVGEHLFTREDGMALQALTHEVAKKYGIVGKNRNGYNLLHRAAARVGALDLGFVPARGGKTTKDMLKAASKGEIKALYLLATDEVDMKAIGKKSFVMYQGHHGDAAAERADVIFPGAAFTEKNATYVNTAGRVQQARMATFPPGEAREDWKIIRALSEHLGHRLPYDNLNQLRDRMTEENPIFMLVDKPMPCEWEYAGKAGVTKTKPFDLPVTNFYMTCAISRNSQTMAQCTQAFVNQSKDKKAA